MGEIDYKKIFNDNLNDLISLLKIKSVYDEKTVAPFMPFGKGVNDALLFMKNIAVNDGFDITEYDGYAISFEFGDGIKRIDIASHLDVVAADDEDFNIRIEDGVLYGRGTSDMKVPMYLIYLSYKLLKEKYPHTNKKIRFVLGTDEERTMNDMKHYVKIAGYPDFAFTPDGYFPIGIGEKGAIMWTLSGDYNGVVKSFNGGSQCNIVSPYATCILNADNIDDVQKYIDENKIDANVKMIEEGMQISSNGIASHASVPFLGHSATIDLLKIIKDIYHDEICSSIHDNYEDYFGSGLNSYVTDDPMECLTINLGILRIENNKVFGQVDCRYPFGKDANILTKNLQEVSKVNVSLDYNDEPTLCSEDDPYVKTMLEAYRSVTNDYYRPIISGGVSYSKVFKHCVSFGPGMLTRPSTAHQKGEHVAIDDILLWFKIYYEALERLILMEG